MISPKYFLHLLISMVLVACGGVQTIERDSVKTNIPTVDNNQNKTEVVVEPPAPTDEKKLVDIAHAHIEKTQATASPHQIKGSAAITRAKATQKNVYFLYGAEHLNLKNYYFDIPVKYNKKVKMWMNYFLNRGKDYFVKYSRRSGRYAPIMGKILEEYGLPRDLIFLAMAESGFQSKAKSWAKAVGPWQFMPFTGKRYGLHVDWYVDERRDPIKSTIAAATHLKDLYEYFGSWELAAAGYNAGQGKVKRAIRRYSTSNFWKLAKGRYLKSETKNYVPKIMALAIIGKNLSSFGFEEIDFHKPLDFDEIDLPGNTDLISFAEATGIPFEEIQRYNPEIMRWVIPPYMKSYKLRVPVGGFQKWTSCCTDKNFIAKDYQTYRLRSYASLRAVARKFKIKGDVLGKLNGIPMSRKLKRGTTVLLPFRSGQSRKVAMYSDLYEKPRKSVRRKRAYRSRIRMAKRRGQIIRNPKNYYTVKRGDTLWDVARKTGQSLDTIIRSNLKLVQFRMIRPGDKLAIR